MIFFVLFFVFVVFKIISYSTLLPIDNPHAVAVSIGITIKPIPVKLNVKELDVVAILTSESNDFTNVRIVFFGKSRIFCLPFLIYGFRL